MEPECDIEATSPSSSEEERAAFCEEVRRIHRRYHVEVVERFGFCPWAEKARLEGKVGIEVELSSTLDARAVTDRIIAISQLDEVEVCMLVFPCVQIRRPEFVQWVDRLRRAAAEAGTDTFAMAAFHPDAEADLTSPFTLVPFLRRSPDPTVQLVRASTLAAVRRGEVNGKALLAPSVFAKPWSPSPATPALHERVAEINLRTVELEAAAIARTNREVFEDRKAAYPSRAKGAQLPRPSELPDWARAFDPA